ncbi:hypothetical protein [Ferroacidibacillus organovorans]|uniref:Uncharacterized protein n=1 Tax=Ferroacidibacillus organovorans TaxID=1765683 RepID=A0A101XPB8_9BACL|nr:hypothetical protein [Ferroacidibacillus organovorans]KUO94946.1 hypothetical protein ATW55_04745 [Ferroacidibacillus organovorans]
MNAWFTYDPRLDLEIPSLSREWSEISVTEREKILEHWERVRGAIPSRISLFEAKIEELQGLLHHEEEWGQTLSLMDQVTDYASRINDLNILFRTQPDAHIEHDTPKQQEHHDREK